MNTHRARTFDISPGREETALAGQDREHSVRVLVQVTECRDHVHEKDFIPGIEGFGSVELLRVKN